LKRFEPNNTVKPAERIVSAQKAGGDMLGSIGNIINMVNSLSKIDLNGLGSLFGSGKPAAQPENKPEALDESQENTPQNEPMPDYNNGYYESKSRTVLYRQMEAHRSRAHKLRQDDY